MAITHSKHGASFLFVCLCFILITPLAVAQEVAKKKRINSGLILLYDFAAVTGNSIVDVSGNKPELRAKVQDEDAVSFSGGAVEFKSQGIIKSNNITPRVAAAVIRSGEVTLEAWVQPANLSQKGPARIFTYSRNSNDRSFTIGQDGNKFEFRVRSTQTSNNGIPSLTSSAGSAKTELTHLVYTRDRTGRTRIYINGELDVEKTMPGDLTNWTADFHLGIGNEMSGDRPWLGKINLLAVYQRDLLPHEVRHQFEAGASAPTTVVRNRMTKTPVASNDEFVSKVAPILAQHCLECHDSATKDGGLDLSTKKSAFAGSDSGPAILPGKPYESAFWTQVVSNEMPQERSPLSSEQKQILKEWIDSGAKWSGGKIDPSLGTASEKSSKVWVRRLTIEEYIATVKATVKVDISSEAKSILPADLRADGFKNTAYNLGVDLKHVSAYAQLAELIVQRMDTPEFLDEMGDKTSDEFSTESIRPLVGVIGKWLFRGPLEDHDFNVYLEIATTVETAGGDKVEAVNFILEAMLQSPRFIYQIESQRGDGSRYPVGDYELASRLSYILWGASPDKELIAAVERGEFYDRSGVAKQVERMLDDPRVIDRSVEFLSQWLDLDRLDNIQPNAEMFPNWDPVLAGDMRAETTEFFKEVVWNQNRPLVDILNAQVTFATPRLAKHYGLKSTTRMTTTKSSRVGMSRAQIRFDLATNPARGGLLTHGSVLSIGGDEASMVTRGLFVLKDLLRGSIKNPPTGVDTTPVESKPGLSQRIVSEQRIADASCGSCHSKFEPLAFGLERFDGLGGYAEKDKYGNALREDGEVLIPGEAKPIPYSTSAELMDLLAKSERVKESLTWKVTQFAIGRPLNQLDIPLVKKIHQEAERLEKENGRGNGNSGATYRSLISAIVLSDLVLTTQTEPSELNSDLRK
ncbi:MAG: DUF1592 domain-containing protein [Mariniblastus sp.]